MLSRASGLAHSTLRRYLALLEATFVLRPLLAWSRNIGKRLVKSPKIHLLGFARQLDGPSAAAGDARSAINCGGRTSLVTRRTRPITQSTTVCDCSLRYCCR
jgi:hypothetical protein